MDDKELRDLQEPGSWDDDRAERRSGLKTARAVVSVAFARQDFERVSEAARVSGMRTSEFIRQAALREASEQQGVAFVLRGYSPDLVFYTARLLPRTRVSGPFAEVKRKVLTA